MELSRLLLLLLHHGTNFLKKKQEIMNFFFRCNLVRKNFVTKKLRKIYLFQMVTVGFGDLVPQTGYLLPVVLIFIFSGKKIITIFLNFGEKSFWKNSYYDTVQQCSCENAWTSQVSF